MLLAPKDWNHMAVFAALLKAVKMPVLAASLASSTCGRTFSASGSTCSAIPVAASRTRSCVSFNVGCKSCCICSRLVRARDIPASAILEASFTCCDTTTSASASRLVVSLANSESAISSPIFVAFSATLPKPQDMKPLAALRPFCILSTGKASPILLWNSLVFSAKSSMAEADRSAGTNGNSLGAPSPPTTGGALPMPWLQSLPPLRGSDPDRGSRCD
mmetsp:Transcript_61003/g.145367  ORF Transcript_61003/g.145367 Transcript_61003/m.145367 type:complete len:218 (-) Transcript_61003:253-906(-)